MFERFTDRARRTVVNAQQEARALGHDYIGPEHLLLGLFGAGGVAAKALESLGIGEAGLRERVEARTGRREPLPSSGHIPFRPAAKRVLEASLAEAQRLGHPYIGTEHLLLALSQQDYGVAARALAEAGADQERVRAETTRLLAEYRRRHEEGQAGDGTGEDANGGDENSGDENGG